MNRTEAKAYVLNELGLDREQVRQFGNLSRTQTWLDAIAAQASGGIASFKASEQPTEPEPVPVPSAATPSPTSPSTLSFEAFWESPNVALNPQPLTSISSLDEDWDDSPEPTATSDEVILYPLVIGLLMLWALVQLLLLAGHGIALGLTALANDLDAAATRRLQAVSTPSEHQPNEQKPTGWMMASP